MRRQLFLASVGAIALTGSAFAADLTPPPPVYVPPAPYSWTGLYVGGQIGYGWGNDPVHTTFFSPGIAAVPGEVPIPGVPSVYLNDSVSNSPQGVIGGGHIGYNLQINQWVVGLEGTVDGTSISKNAFDPFTGLTLGTRTGVQGSIRARAGIAWDRFLIYATGGAAFAGITNNYTDTLGVITGVPGVSDGISKTRAGWTVGGGLAYAITDNWSVRAEYRYSDFGHYTDTPLAAFVIDSPAFGSRALAVQHHLTENQVQAGFSYKFGPAAAAPVVAKY
jgi:outer membrane immunogenic protein